jgi:protein SCO1
VNRRALDVSVAAVVVVAAVGALLVMLQSRGGARHYALRGTVVRLLPGTDSVVVVHEPVAGLMPAMTMPFRVKSRAEIAGLHSGDTIVASLQAGGGHYDLAGIKVIGPAPQEGAGGPGAPEGAATAGAEAPRPVAAPPAGIRPGADTLGLPRVRLVDASGRRFRTSALLGGPVALGFIHTRCANPDACPRLARLLTETQELIGPPTELRGRGRLLTVTLDPAYDTPARLARYGKERGADPSLWILATGDSAALGALRKAAGLTVHGKGPRMTHGEVLLVFGSNGRLFQRFEGLKWTAQELAGALERAAGR